VPGSRVPAVARADSPVAGACWQSAATTAAILQKTPGGWRGRWRRHTPTSNAGGSGAVGSHTTTLRWVPSSLVPSRPTSPAPPPPHLTCSPHHPTHRWHGGLSPTPPSPATRTPIGPIAVRARPWNTGGAWWAGPWPAWAPFPPTGQTHDRWATTRVATFYGSPYHLGRLGID